jgi:hypothetical protein
MPIRTVLGSGLVYYLVCIDSAGAERTDEWIVEGQYKDKQIQVTDSGYNAAIKRWREAATDRGK